MEIPFQNILPLASDQRVYILKDMVNGLLNTPLSVNKKEQFLEMARSKEEENPDFKGLTALVEAAMNCKTGLKRISVTWCSNVTLTEAIKFYTEGMNQDFSEGKPHSFNDLSWKDLDY